MDDITSAAAGYATSGTVNAFDTATAAAANVQDLPADAALPAANADSAPPTASTDAALPTADAAPPTSDVASPTTDTDVAPRTADVALPTASTASSSRGDSRTQPCWVFTIPPDLPLTENE
eukprot:g14971.t1